MHYRLRVSRLLLLVSFAITDAKDPELPLCPTNLEYFPQNLPMHCRMPGTVPPYPSPVYQNPSIGKQPMSMPVNLPGMPGPIAGPMPGPMSMPMMPMPPVPAQKLPVIVMPFYSQDTSGKHPHTSHQVRPPRKRRIHVRKKRPIYYSSDEDSTDDDLSTDTDDSGSTSSERGFWRGPRAGRRSNSHQKTKKRKQQQHREILTPILQYVTKDGYVIFEKQISKGEAKDWLVSKSENKNIVDKNGDHREYKLSQPKDVKGGKILMNKNVEEIEMKTEINPHLPYKKNNHKRKPTRQ